MNAPAIRRPGRASASFAPAASKTRSTVAPIHPKRSRLAKRVVPRQHWTHECITRSRIRWTSNAATPISDGSRLARHEYHHIAARPQFVDGMTALGFGHLFRAKPDAEQIAASGPVHDRHTEFRERAGDCPCRGLAG